MRHDRWVMRGIKTAVLAGAAGLVVEGMFEVKLLASPFIDPPSVPGRSKILEHFAVQHVVFPAIGVMLAVAPKSLRGVFRSRLTGAVLVGLTVAVTIPEVLVSRADLFRPYPFDLHIAALEAVQMVDIGGLRLNLLQAQHLIFAHGALMGAIAVTAVRGTRGLRRFAGPRTGERSFV